MNALALAASLPLVSGAALQGHRRFRECTSDSDCSVIPGDTCVRVPGSTGTSICMNTVTEDFCGTQDNYALDLADTSGPTSGCFWMPFREFEWSASNGQSGRSLFSENLQGNRQAANLLNQPDGDPRRNLNVESGQPALGTYASLATADRTTPAGQLSEDQARGLYPCNVFPKHLFKCCNGCDTVGPRNEYDLFSCAAYNGIVWSGLIDPPATAASAGLPAQTSQTNRYVPTYYANTEPRCPCQAPSVATADADPVLAAGALSDCGSSVSYTQNGQQVSTPEQCCTLRKFPEWMAAIPENPADAADLSSHQYPHTRDLGPGGDAGLYDPMWTSNLGNGKPDFWWQVNGWCFNPLTEKCCDDGAIYNPGLFKCCAVEGVLPISNPCQCSANTHCKDPSRLAGEQRDTECCMEGRSGNPSVDNTASAAHSECDRYHKFHNYQAFAIQVQGAAVGARPLNCAGHCIDKSYQICCNGAVCQAASESCCDNVCCNKFSEKCTEGAAQDDMGWLQFLYARTNPHFDAGIIADGGAKASSTPDTSNPIVNARRRNANAGSNPNSLAQGFINPFRLTLDNFAQAWGSRSAPVSDTSPGSLSPLRYYYVDNLADTHMLRTSSEFKPVDTDAGAAYTPTAYNLGAEKLYCTRLEEQNAHTMYFAYVWPTTLLFAFTVAAGIVLSHLTRWAMRPLSLIEKIVLASAVASALFSLPTWFHGANYVFGIVISWAAFFTLLAVGSGLRKPVLLAAFVNLVVFLYIVNPFRGNNLLNLQRDNQDNMIEAIFKTHRLDTLESAGVSSPTYHRSTQRIVNFESSLVGGPSDSVVSAYNGYFQLDPRLLDFRTWNPYEMYFGYATRGWSIAVGVFILISFIALFVQVILLVIAYFIHTHGDAQKAEVESALSPAFEEPAEDVLGADPTSTGFREMDGAPLAARGEVDHLIAARKPLT